MFVEALQLFPSEQIRHMKSQKRSSVAQALGVARWHTDVYKKLNALSDSDDDAERPSSSEVTKRRNAKKGEIYEMNAWFIRMY
jgi:hypothetical protein